MAAASADLRNIEVRTHAGRDGSPSITFRVGWIDDEGKRGRETFADLDQAIARSHSALGGAPKAASAVTHGGGR